MVIFFILYYSIYIITCIIMLLLLLLYYYYYYYCSVSCVLKWEDPHDSAVYCVESDCRWMFASGTNRYGVVSISLSRWGGGGGSQIQKIKDRGAKGHNFVRLKNVP